ncbi:eIF2A-related protein [Streptomyces sp. NEAU-H22]|uniref:nSTAND1 domain-containing NTPase n=1 Tax=Streptomyces sp. NEAU-H22 TaxID=2994655 RepID=UPI003A599BD3
MSSVDRQPADMLAPDLPAAVARILGPGGTVAGAGFLVAEGVVVTCAHVVEAAGGGPGADIVMSFPHVADAGRVEGHVAAELWRPVDDEDVAFLRLSRTALGMRPLPLGSAEGSRGHHVCSFGFPAQAPPEGHFGYGVTGDFLPGVAGRRTHLQLTDANDLTTGFSGGPVLDEVTGLVIGMLTEITAPDAYERGQGIAYVTPTQVLREVQPELAEREVCPYRGLEPFTAEHARWFEGRTDAVQQVLTNLAQRRGLTLLLGPSGSGKSSLVQAGVLRALAEGEVPGSDRWLPVLIRPRQDMLAEIERAGLPGAKTDGIVAAVNRRLRAEPAYQRVLLVIDQFEELLMQTSNGRLRELLGGIDEVTAAADAHAKITVVLVMRDDFYPRLAALAPRLLEAATPGLLNVPGTLSLQDLHDIISLPAEDVGLHLQPGLPEQIISDVLETTPDASLTRQAPVIVLPLLEMTLRQLWDRRKDGYLTHEAYRRIGGVSGSMTTWCDNALDELSSEQQVIARRALTSLVHPADPSHNITAVRTQVPLNELRDLAADPSDTPNGEKSAVDTVIAVLARRRIITTQTLRPPQRTGAPPGEPVAELIHEALIRDWGALRAWVDQDHRFQEWLDRTRERQHRWADQKHPGDLLGGTALAEGVEWSQQRRLPSDITEFLTASKERQRAAIRRSRVLNAVLGGLLVLALMAAGGALWQWRTANAQRHAAQSKQLASQSDTLFRANPELASLLAVQAYRTSHTPESIESLRTAAALPLHRRLTGHTDDVNLVAFSPDGHTLATASNDATVRLWDIATGKTRTTLKGHDDAVWSVAFSPDGRTLATGSGDATVRLWDIATGKTRTTLKGHDDAVTSVAFGPDGQTLATGGVDATVRLWNTATGKTRTTLTDHTDEVNSVAFSPDGRALATGDFGGTVRLWDVAAGKTRATLRGHDSPVWSVAFSPDGRTVATAGEDSTLRLWDVAAGKTRATLRGHDGEVSSVAFSPDGRTLATVSIDATVRLWDMATGKTRTTLRGHAGAVWSVAFSPDGRTLATGGVDATGRVWDVATGATRASLSGHTHEVDSVAFSPDGRILASGAFDMTARLWDVSTGKTRATLTGHEGAVWSVAFSPDGRTLATASFDATVRLWDVSTGRTHTTLRGHEDAVLSVAFSPDGRTLATAGGDATVRLWDVSTGKTRATLTGHEGTVKSVAFSPDGRTLATASIDDTVRLWDVSTSKSRTTLRGHTSWVNSVAFSPDGHTLATASDDDTVRLWDVSTGKTRATLTGHAGGVWSAAFSPDGRTLATASNAPTVRLWDVASGKAVATLSGHNDTVSSVAFSPDGRTLATGSVDYTVRVSDVTLPQPHEAIEKICRAVNRDLTPEERTAYLSGQSAGPVCPAR